jgi:hypothetical protein
VPTESYFRLIIEGPASALDRFRADEALWAVDPWRGMFRLHVQESKPERLVYLYGDDYKRPAPNIEPMAAKHHELRFTLEHCDEFGTVAGRAGYANGRKVASERVDPSEFDWMEWENEEE